MGIVDRVAMVCGHLRRLDGFEGKLKFGEDVPISICEGLRGSRNKFLVAAFFDSKGVMQKNRFFVPVVCAAVFGLCFGCSVRSVAISRVMSPVGKFHYAQPFSGAVYSAGFAGAAASTSTSSVIMSFNGLCATLPNPANPVHQGFASGYGVLVYGLGRLDTPDCGDGAGGVDLFDGSGVPAALGSPVIGAGSLTTLRAYVTTPGSTAQSGKIIVYINGAPSPMTCMLGKATMCADDVDTPAVSDNDRVAVTVQLVPGDAMAGLQVMVGKQ
jgi:hypothetical protein